MLLHKGDDLFASPDWTYEPKWDGFRTLASVRDGSVRLLSRNGHSFTHLFGPVSAALRGFPTSILLDGEVVGISDDGHPDFEALQARLRHRDGTLPGHICYLVFDCLYVNGHSVLNRPLEERQAILRGLQPVLQMDAVKLTEGFPAEQSKRLMKACALMGLEGVVMKRRGSAYRPGVRSPDWVKVPIRHREDFVIAGYLPSARGFRTLILGQYDKEGQFVYAGLCGTGLSEEARAAILAELRASRRKTCSFRTAPILRDNFGELPGHASPMGQAHHRRRSRVQATAEGGPAARGSQGTQARQKARSDPPVSPQRPGFLLERAVVFRIGLDLAMAQVIVRQLRIMNETSP
jgi:bifunctional non-homologous end joining protein LigD